MINLERTMEIDPNDLELMCWLLGCYDIEKDEDEEEEKELKEEND